MTQTILHFFYITPQRKQLQMNEEKELLKSLTKRLLSFVQELKAINEENNQIYYFRIVKLMHLVVPIITAMFVYHYLKHLLIFDAYRYESFVKKRWKHMGKLSKQLNNLSNRYGNFYFCYMPLNHGTALPRPYSLFVAVKEVLVNANRPASRVLRTNLLQHLLHAEHDGRTNFKETDYLAASHHDLDPLSEFNLDIMKCCRELIIQGVKDFDVMSSVYQVMETVVENAE